MANRGYDVVVDVDAEVLYIHHPMLQDNRAQQANISALPLG